METVGGEPKVCHKAQWCAGAGEGFRPTGTKRMAHVARSLILQLSSGQKRKALRRLPLKREKQYLGALQAALPLFVHFEGTGGELQLPESSPVVQLHGGSLLSWFRIRTRRLQKLAPGAWCITSHGKGNGARILSMETEQSGLIVRRYRARPSRVHERKARAALVAP